MEFKPRGSFAQLTDMIGGGPHRLQPGQWTDDTSMALCLASSLVANNGFDPNDQMNRYTRWAEEGYLSSTGICFDIGGTVSTALGAYKESGDPFSGPEDPMTGGNGCLMRLAPVPMFFYPNQAMIVSMSGESSRTTHGARECIDACRLFGFILYRAFNGRAKDSVLFGQQWPEAEAPLISESICSIAAGCYRNKNGSDIHGTGYVVQSLEAALWCFHQTTCFSDAVLTAANLGDDADTTAAICGQIAGAYYGIEEIPETWIACLSMKELIQDLADKLVVRE